MNILVISSDVTRLKVADRSLREFGDVQTCEDFSEAMNILNRDGKWDVCMTDLMLPITSFHLAGPAREGSRAMVAYGLTLALLAAQRGVTYVVVLHRRGIDWSMDPMETFLDPIKKSRLAIGGATCIFDAGYDRDADWASVLKDLLT